jgi:hypothetical protein
MDRRQGIYEGARRLLDIYFHAANFDGEQWGVIVRRLTGTDITSDAFVASMRYLIERESDGREHMLNLPGVWECVLDGFAFGAALAAHHHESKNQESANGCEGKTR